MDSNSTVDDEHGQTERESELAEDFGAHLRAGAAIYNAGEFHAAHDAWESVWLDLKDGPDRELLNGLIQFTAAVYHADQRNWAGTTGLARSGQEYLSGLGSTHRAVSLDPLRGYLTALERDPARIEREPPVGIVVAGERVRLGELPFGAIAIAARVLTEEHGGDRALIDRAIEYGRADLEAGQATSPFVTLLVDIFRSDGVERDTARQRLSDHVRRRTTQESDVKGLFE
ncbi:DUF309 domain-containing protein [Halocatena pleomorpha]|uniref:DUF309 domain-containing protein n=1 Tax=Halocatena pleomorpha TaxID=1785090 RepID=A0A3P3R4L5_9EURY|nr:DUF309 domain-containing protein [Halocatena pleomorpha]RRJ28437.1 DUF309 domain-containing protein [Halocatena pleomorpha]